MKKLLVTCAAAIALFALALPAQALPNCNGAEDAACAFRRLGRNETAKTHVSSGGTVTLHAVFNAHPKGTYFLEIIGPNNAVCFVSNDPFYGAPTTQPDGDWSCSVTGAAGRYDAIFMTLSGGPVSGTLVFGG